MERKHVLIIVLAVLLLARAAGGTWLGITARDRAARQQAGEERANTLELARGYMERQEYERAMELLDRLLLKNPKDQEASALLDEIIRRKQASALESKQQELAAMQRQQAQLQAGRQELGSSLEEKTPQERTPVVVAPKQVPEDASAKERARLKKINSLMAQGVQKLNDEQYAAARKLFGEVLELDPDNAQANAYSGKAWFDENPENPANVQAAVDSSTRAART